MVYDLDTIIAIPFLWESVFKQNTHKMSLLPSYLVNSCVGDQVHIGALFFGTIARLSQGLREHFSEITEHKLLFDKGGDSSGANPFFHFLAYFARIENRSKNNSHQ